MHYDNARTTRYMKQTHQCIWLVIMIQYPSLQACDKQRLRLICKQDESVLAFLFYMKGTMSGEHQFESALCEGWFIQVLDKEKVVVANPPVPNNEPSFYFVIEK